MCKETSCLTIAGLSFRSALAVVFLFLQCVVQLDLALAQVSVLTQHNDNLRTGANMSETTLNTSNVNVSSFGKLFCLPVDGYIYAQPLYVPGLTINGTTHNVLFVATANDSVYAFDADAQNNGNPLWKTSLGTPVPTSVIGTTNIQVEVGIISTPVVDSNAKILYVVGKIYSSGTQNFFLHALDITTGVDKIVNGGVKIGATYPGTGDASSNGILTFDASKQNQRTALTLVNGILYIAFGSHEDHDPYHGWLLAYDSSTLKQVAAFNTTPNGGRGAIWMGGQGLVADSNNNVYFITGNSNSNSDQSSMDAPCSYGESFVKLALSASGKCPGQNVGGKNISVLDFFKPDAYPLSCTGCPYQDNYDYLNEKDLDLGSGGPLQFQALPISSAAESRGYSI